MRDLAPEDERGRFFGRRTAAAPKFSCLDVFLRNRSWSLFDASNGDEDGSGQADRLLLRDFLLEARRSMHSLSRAAGLLRIARAFSCSRARLPALRRSSLRNHTETVELGQRAAKLGSIAERPRTHGYLIEINVPLARRERRLVAGKEKLVAWWRLIAQLV